MMEVNRKIAGKTRWSKQGTHTLTAAGADLESPPTGAENMVAGIAGSGLWALSSQFSVLSSQFSVLSSQFSELDVLVVCGRRYFFALVCDVDWVAVLGAA
jgi:hypothetical protein